VSIDHSNAMKII